VVDGQSTVQDNGTSVLRTVGRSVAV